jgi:hypothetical protein
MSTKPSNLGQASVEFLVVVSMLLILLGVAGMGLYKMYTEYADLSLEMMGRDITLRMAENINQLVIVGDGYQKNFYLNTRYIGDEFNITISKTGQGVFVENEDRRWSLPLLTNKVYCCNVSCSTDGENMTLRLNTTQMVRMVNYQNMIFIGQKCPEFDGFPKSNNYTNATPVIKVNTPLTLSSEVFVGARFIQTDNPIDWESANISVNGYDVTAKANKSSDRIYVELNTTNSPPLKLVAGMTRYSVLVTVNDTRNLTQKDLFKIIVDAS